jgi:hypothetical protein
MSRYVLLSFDVEEFDIPLEYNQPIGLEEQMEIGRRGLEALMPVINAYSLTCTMFTTANYALQFPETIKQLSQQHEIASHTFYHSSFQNKHLSESKEALETITGTPVVGLRMPRMKKVDIKEVAKAGYVYDSSINPTLVPGRYNNLNSPRTLFKEGAVYRLPVSVSPLLRLPLFWLAFKNYPYSLFYNLCLRCIKREGYVCLYFHPWEFTNIKNYKLPGYVKNVCGETLLKKLERLIIDLKKDCEFISIKDFIHKRALTANLFK